MTLSATLFVVSNVAITLGYVFLAAFVVPRVAIRLRRTKVGGVGFFLLCGLHHLENVTHVLFSPQETVEHAMLSLHMLLIDVPQAVCVWLFVTGLYLEVVKWGPWSADSDILRSLVASRIQDEADLTEQLMAEAEARRKS